MKRLLAFAAGVLMLASCSETFNATRALQGGMMAAQALSLSDEQVQAYVHQYITQLDAQSKVLPESNAYTKRLRNLTKGLVDVEGVPLNFKVYQEDQVNAFACADGSVRVYTGIMDVMTDNELLGVIGHEIGHVALKHTTHQEGNADLHAHERGPGRPRLHEQHDGHPHRLPARRHRQRGPERPVLQEAGEPGR